ncbi:MAG: twin-arginine translocase TatA/TatE family subunit [Deltaproteobacteria bacterium]|nr:twin-arginine translocase TatA/TatE family subunit [Deltaproteobacteria bacterium]
MFGLGVPEILVIALILLLIFGAKRLPSIGEGLGKTVKELRNIKKDMKAAKEPEKGKVLETGESKASDAGAEEGDLADAIQKKVTQKVTDKVLGQVPGIKQAKQLKDKADKIKKLVS